MKALFLTESSEEKLRLQSTDKPVAGQDEALVKLNAAALNHRDQWCREGKYPRIKYNSILGSDGSGVVAAVGDDSNRHWVGEEIIINPNINWGYDPLAQSVDYRILGMPDNGTFAEYIVVNVDRLHKKPQHLSLRSAAALPLGGVTAYRATFTHGHVKAGDNVLISGVGGGVAQFAFLYSVAVKANVYCTSGSDYKINAAKKLGAKGGYNYKNPDWLKEALRDSGGFNVIIDSAGGDQINDFIKVLQPGGAIVFYGATNGLPKNLDLFRLYWCQGRLQGSTMGSDEEFAAMIKFTEKYSIQPIIDSTRPLDEIISAFDDMKAGKQFGKILIDIENN